VFKGSKRLYQWTFDTRKPGGEWQFVSITLTDSTYSKKKTLAVNSKRIIDQLKIPNFGKQPINLDVATIPVFLFSSPKPNLDYDLRVGGSLFSELLKQYE